MANDRLALRYAKSLLALAIERGELDAAHKDMQLVADVCAANHDLILLLKSPVIRTDKKAAILGQIFKPVLGTLTMSFIEIITAKKREYYLPDISTRFLREYKRNKNILTATVTTCFGLDEKLRGEIMKVVKATDSTEVELTEKIDKALIGGFVLKVGDNQIDASIKHKLSQLARNFSENPYVKDF